MIEQAEQVLCVPTIHLPGVASGGTPFRGFLPYTEEELAGLLGAGSWKKRDKAESDPAFKQVIPYCFLYRPDGSLLWYRRSKERGDGRLLGKASLGFGGHINPSDLPSWEGHDPAVGYLAAITVGMHRELVEELGIVSFQPRLRGLVNDDSDPVGQVHLGLVYFVRWTDGTLPSLKEGDGSYSLGFHPLDEPPVDTTEMESWSLIVWKSLQARVWA